MTGVPGRDLDLGGGDGDGDPFTQFMRTQQRTMQVGMRGLMDNNNAYTRMFGPTQVTPQNAMNVGRMMEAAMGGPARQRRRVENVRRERYRRPPSAAQRREQAEQREQNLRAQAARVQRQRARLRAQQEAEMARMLQEEEEERRMDEELRRLNAARARMDNMLFIDPETKEDQFERNEK